jgi:DNA-binding transcriptional ArsR family regulator
MSTARARQRDPLEARAAIFAALGDPTRLSLLAQLSRGEPRSITRLAERTTLTRQAVTKHLRVLEGVGVVKSVRAGRESLFAFRPEPLEDLRAFLERISGEWDVALGRLKTFVED